MAGKNLSAEIIVFFISLLPVLELRGGLIAAKFLGLEPAGAFLLCFAANILPLPFILLLIKKVFALMRKFNVFPRVVDKLERVAAEKGAKVQKKWLFGLFCFVAVPLPGTGGWTGSLIAALLGMEFKKTLPVVVAGVFCAGLIMLTVAYFIPGLFGF